RRAEESGPDLQPWTDLSAPHGPEPGLHGLGHRVLSPGRRRGRLLVLVDVEAVADVADRADERLEVAELRAQPPHVHVDRAGAAEVVVAPHLAEQLLAGEDARGVRGEEAQQFELLEGEVERPS